MPLSDLDQSLAALEGAFKAAPADLDPYALPDPGIYQAVFREVDFFEQKNPPNAAYLKLVFEIALDPKWTGKRIDFIHCLEPHLLFQGEDRRERVEQKLSFLKKDLARMGIDADAEDFSLAQVRPGSEMWDTVLDSPFEIKIMDSKKVNPETGKPYRNAYIGQRLGGPVKSDLPTPDMSFMDAAPVAASDDDIPF